MQRHGVKEYKEQDSSSEDEERKKNLVKQNTQKLMGAMKSKFNLKSAESSESEQSPKSNGIKSQEEDPFSKAGHATA